MAGSVSHWRIVENVVAAVERSLSNVEGTVVSVNAMIPERAGGTHRQVDVSVEIPTGHRVLRVGIEVRDRASPTDLPAVEQLVTKLKKLDIDLGCIVSRDGFTSQAERAAEDGGIELRTLAEVEQPSWWLASTVQVRRSEVELVKMQINFSPEELPAVAELLADVDGRQVEITSADGDTNTLYALVAGQGIQALGRPEVAEMSDGATFVLKFELGSLEGAAWNAPRGRLPPPPRH